MAVLIPDEKWLVLKNENFFSIHVKRCRLVSCASVAICSWWSPFGLCCLAQKPGFSDLSKGQSLFIICTTDYWIGGRSSRKDRNQSWLQEDGPLETTNMEPPGAKMERRQFQASRQKTLLTFRCHRRRRRRCHRCRHHIITVVVVMRRSDIWHYISSPRVSS